MNLTRYDKKVLKNPNHEAYCYYCGKKKIVAMYRINTLYGSILQMACIDCLPKVKRSKYSGEWKQWGKK